MGIRTYKAGHEVEQPFYTNRNNHVHQNQVNFIIAESLFWEKNIKALKKLMMKPITTVKKIVKMALKPN